MKFHGKVIRQLWGSGSKSEHVAVVLQTSDGPLKLRRAGGNPFHDEELENLVGQTITCEGDVASGHLLMSCYEVSPARE